MKWLESNITIYLLFFVLFPLVAGGILFIEKQKIKSVFFSSEEKFAGRRLRRRAEPEKIRTKITVSPEKDVGFASIVRLFLAEQACCAGISFIGFYPDG